MEQKLTLLPLVGMEWQGQTLPFGASSQEADGVLGTPDQAGEKRRYYFDSELRLDFDGAGKLNFIEFLGGAGGALQPELYGVPLFRTDGEALLELLAGHGTPTHLDGGYTVTVPEISLGLYREITPADVEAMVEEMARIDVTNLSHVDLEAERQRSRRWDTVGIGTKDYYSV